MGNPKLKWTVEEEDALLAGIARHSAGKWKTILTDPDFAPIFCKRTNIDLKDKWRNLSASSATGHQGMRDKSRIPIIMSLINSASSANTQSQCNDSQAIVPHEMPLDVVMEDAPNGSNSLKNSSQDNDMIYEAISTANNPNGLDIGAIFSFIEKKRGVRPSFRRQLSAKLRKLVAKGKLDKVQNCYVIKRDALPLSLPESKIPVVPPELKEGRPQQPQTNGQPKFDSEMEEASVSAVYMIADAENKSYLACEAVKESKRVMKLREEAECFLLLAQEIHERCSQGQVVILT